MKTLSEQINWHREFENRRWKRIVNCVELSLFALLGAVVVIVVITYGNGGNLQPAFVLCTSLLTLSTACIAPAAYQKGRLTRWHIKVIKLGFICGMSISALAGFLILETQLVST